MNESNWLNSVRLNQQPQQVESKLACLKCGCEWANRTQSVKCPRCGSTSTMPATIKLKI